MTVYIGIPYKKFGYYRIVADDDAELQDVKYRVRTSGPPILCSVTKDVALALKLQGAMILDHKTWDAVRTYLTWLKNAA